MAKDKKGFMLYADMKTTVEKLSDEDAGKLMKHIFRYVNDENPQVPNVSVDLVFEPIKMALKRDLKKWEDRAERSRLNGSLGGRPKNPTKPSGLINNPEKPKKPDRDRVIDRDSVSVINKEYEYSLEREVLNQVAKLFDSKYYDTESKKKKWLDTIRLLMTTDGHPKEEIIQVIKFASNDEFWKSNLLSIPALRKKNDSGVMKYDSILAKMPKQSIENKNNEQVPEHIKKSLGIR